MNVLPTVLPTMRSRIADTGRVFARRWHGLLPAVLALAALSCLWGAVALADGYWSSVAEGLDELFPVVAALRDGAAPEEAADLAARLEEREEIRWARVVTAAEAVIGLLPAGRSWAREVASIDSKFIPPALHVAVEGAVMDEDRRRQARVLLRKDRSVDFIWPDGPDLAAARGRMAETRRILDGGRWLALLALSATWLAFLLIDLRHFVSLTGRRRSLDFAAESQALRHVGPIVMRGIVVAVFAGILATIALAIAPMVWGLALPGGAMAAAWLRAMAFAAVAGVVGHFVVGALLWGRVR